jgi:hypothetical protein
MLLPQVAEDDHYDQWGTQTDDINSVAEYIAVTLGYDHTVDDEDDDGGQNLHLPMVDTYYTPVFCEIEAPVFLQKEITHFPEYITPALRSMPQNKITPPPDLFI